MANEARSIIWVDAGGRTTQTIPRTLTGAGTIMSTLEGHSNAGVASWWESTETFPGGSGTSAQFPDVRDRVRLTFTTATGELVNLSLPAPKGAIFKADGVTVDPSAIADVIAACIGNLCTAAGVAVSAYVGGVRGQINSNN